MSAVPTTKHTLSVLVENKPGVLARIAGLFSRRGFNIESLGMVRQWQTLFYNERYSNTDLQRTKGAQASPVRIPDFVALAEALGCVGLRCESKDDVDAVIEKAMAITDAPVVIDFVVGADAQVWPMVAAGTGNDQIMAARHIRPLFDDPEAVQADEVSRADHPMEGEGRAAERSRTQQEGPVA